MHAAALPLTPPRSTRYGIRAPRGGCTVGGRLYKGGQFCPPWDSSNPHGVRLAEAPVAAVAPPLDITRTDGLITVADPETGDVAVFRVRRAEGGKFAGRRIVSVLVGDEPEWEASWRGFAFADDFGLAVWSRYKGRPEVAGERGWAAMLTESGRLAAEMEYRVTN